MSIERSDQKKKSAPCGARSLLGRAVEEDAPPTKRSTFYQILPLAVPPRIAWKMLSCGHDHGYRLLREGKLRSFRRGSRRLVEVASIRELIEREVAADAARPLDASLTARRLSKRTAAAAAQETPTERAPPPRRTPRGRYAAKAAAE